ncbi:MAG TPA: hypothetical protein VIH99_12730 [Bdellovibrionota bacterium]|jgi:hypothetical protein
MKRKITIALLATSSLLFTSCGEDTNVGTALVTAVGAGGGAYLGKKIAHNNDHNETTGMVLGAATGGVLGYLLGGAIQGSGSSTEMSRPLAWLQKFLMPSAFADKTPTVAKAKFVDEFKKKLPVSFCDEKTYFRQCYSSAADSCKTASALATMECTAAVEKEIPAQLQQPADGQTWGKKIGTCAGEKVALAMAKEAKGTADCKDLAKWQ